MKKIIKLQLSRQTIRILRTHDLEDANGGDIIVAPGPGGAKPPKHTNSIAPCCASLWEICPSE